MFLRRILLALAVSVLFPTFAFACDFDDADGLDVGLVLSGGGAKASTQVGVMKLIDELGIPIHCVTGTSMGAVVGAFYAAGYSADEIGNILTDNDWGETFRGDAPRRDKSFIEKEREEAYFSGNIAGIDHGKLKLPGGINKMQGLKLLYRNILSDIPQDIDFDDLELPFRAVAADLETGEVKAFEKGDLVESILASMAVPGVFPPREIKSRFYVDGGIASTLPVKTAQDMGADIIIALDVSNAPITPKAGISVAATANQITTIVVWRSLQRDISYLKKDDLLIHPNTIDVTTAGYRRAAEGLLAGYENAQNYREALLEIKARAAPMVRQEMTFPTEITTDSIKIVNNSKIADALILKRYQNTGEPKDDLKAQDRRLRNLASFGGFGEVDIGRSNGEAVLTVNENTLGQNLMQIGINATNDFNGNSSYSVLTRLTRKPLSRQGGDLSVSAEIGTNLGLSAELYYPLGPKGRYFVQPELFTRWSETNLDLFEERVGSFWINNTGLKARLGRELGQWGVVALETELNQIKARNIVTVFSDLEPETEQNGSIGIYVASDTLNRTDWPTSGQRIRLRGRRSFDLNEEGRSSDRFEASLLAAFDVKNVGVLLNSRYGKTKDRNPTTGDIDFFQLGGFRQLSSLANNSIPVSEFTFGSIELYKRLTASGNIFDLPLYAGGLLEGAYFPLDILGIDDKVFTVSGSVYLGADTAIGPIFFGTAYGDSDDVKVFFKFGRTF